MHAYLISKTEIELELSWSTPCLFSLFLMVALQCADSVSHEVGHEYKQYIKKMDIYRKHLCFSKNFWDICFVSEYSSFLLNL